MWQDFRSSYLTLKYDKQSRFENMRKFPILHIQVPSSYSICTIKLLEPRLFASTATAFIRKYNFEILLLDYDYEILLLGDNL